MLKIQFEHDYQRKIMVQTFQSGTVIENVRDVQTWRSQWMQELKSWHSPYKCFIDLSAVDRIEHMPEIVDELKRMRAFFDGLFLKSAVVGSSNTLHFGGLKDWPFTVIENYAEAQQAVGLNRESAPRAAVDFRSLIQFQNHFAQHVVELSFLETCVVDSKDKINILKSKMMNNLMQWHSKWSLLVDCTNVTFSPEIRDEWTKLEKFLNGLFLKTAIGYGPSGDSGVYPFKVYRARHKAVADLESEGFFMGNEADCKSKKST
jgi:hypothetical protein